jgi:putative FmdB family regulatory protein
MPIYEYKCATCGAQVEKMQKVSDEPLTVCENCGGKMQKQWSLSGFQFKGEGWYVTDYAGKKADKGGKVETTEKTDKTDKSEKSSTSESTASSDSASNTKSDSSDSAKKEAVSKKD